MFKDRYGLPLTTASQAAADAYVEGIDLLLSQNPDPGERFLSAIAHDDGFAMAHVALGLYQQLRADMPGANAAFARARERTGGTSAREQSLIAAVTKPAAPGTSARGGALDAIPMLEQHLDEFPRDYLAVNRLTQTLFFSGLPKAREQAKTVLDRSAPFLSDDWAFLGGHAFILEEFRHYDEASDRSERALELYPRYAGATHVVAHVNYETCSHGSGSHRLAAWLSEYDRQMPFYCHLSWHLALFELAQGHYSRAVEIYDNDIAPAVASPTKLADLASFRWRQQLYGCSAGELDWQAMRQLAEAAAGAPAMGFFAAHAAFWCAVVQDEATLGRLIGGLRDLDAKGHPVAGSVALPLVQGIAAFGRGDYDETIRQIEPVTGDIIRLGGSHAQREVFEDTLLGAYLRGGHFDKAETLLQQRLARRASARDFAWLAEAQTGLARQQDALASLDQSRSLWREAEAANPEQRRTRDLEASLR
jgi:tetratricopeptide (TPR) repeat protein